jgi:SPP1 gp7 family putative phage head morphogenesis protein
MNHLLAVRVLAQRARRARRPLPKPLSALPLERRYQAVTQGILAGARAKLLRAWPRIVTLGQHRDDWTDEIDDVFTDLRSLSPAFTELLRQQAQTQAAAVQQHNKENFKRTMRAALGVDVFHDSPRVASTAALFVQENVGLLTSIPDRYLAEVEGIVLRNFQQGRRAEDFQQELKDRFGVAESRAALIARDQTLKLNGALTMNRQTALGVTSYYWRTSQDERVRESHAELEGQRFDWADPPDVGNPGEDYQCRCHGEPDVSDLLGPDEGDQPDEE